MAAPMTEQEPQPENPAPTVPAGAWWLLPLVLLLTALVHAPSLSGELVYDDLLMVAENPLIQSWANVGEAFRGAYWDFLDPEQASRIGYWRPLTAVALTLGHSLGGGDVWAFHLLSILAHLAATSGAFLLARRLLRSATGGFWVALLFGLHPLHVESVAWITALNDPLFGAFGLLSLWAFVRWRDAGSRGFPWAAALLLIPALLAKELAAAVVPLALAIDLGRAAQRREWVGARQLFAYLPFALVGLGYYLVRTQVFESPLAGFDRITTEFDFDDARITALRVEILGRSLALLAWPDPLTVFRPVRPVFEWGSSEARIALIAIGAWIALGLWAWRARSGAALAGLLLIPAGLAPVLWRVESLGLFPISDRFLYLPVLGAALAAVALCERAFSRAVAAGLLALVCAGCAWKSVVQIDVWSDNERLHRHAVEAAPESPYARWTLGGVLMREYQESEDLADLRDSFQHFLASEELLLRARSGDPAIFATADDYLQSNIGKAWCFLFEAMVDEYGDFETPKRVFELTIEARPTSVEAYTGLGTVLWQMAERGGAGPRREELRSQAEDAFESALQLHERFIPANLNLGRLHAAFGDWKRARPLFERCIELRPGDPRPWMQLAQCWFEEGWVDRARDIAQEAHEKFPESPVAMRLLGTFAAARNDSQQALQWFDRVLERNPDDGEAVYQRASVLHKLGESTEAIRELRRACDLLVDRFEPHYDLGALLLSNGAEGEAKRYLARAYELGSEDPSTSVQQALANLRNQLVLLFREDAEQLYKFASADRHRNLLPYASIWVQAALQANDQHGPSWYLQGTLQRAGQAEDLAVDSLRNACRLMSEAFEPHRDLGLLLASQGQAQEALEYLNRARELGPPSEWSADIRDAESARVEARIRDLSDVQGPTVPREG